MFHLILLNPILLKYKKEKKTPKCVLRVFNELLHYLMILNK